MCHKIQWLVLLSSVEYSSVSQYSGMFVLLSVEYSRASQYRGLFYFYWLDIHVVTVQWLVLLVNCSCLSQYSDWVTFYKVNLQV